MKKQPSASFTKKSSDFFRPSNPESVFKKEDPEDFRLGNFSEAWPPQWIDDTTAPPIKNVTLIGYPDDEGIQLNGGRLGAAKGPDAVRSFFYKMTPCWKDSFKIFDAGNLSAQNHPLLDRHELARAHAESILRKSHPLVCLGGGHDYGFPDASAFLENCLRQKKEKPVVVNLDAHLDVRPFEKIPHSGTPFRRLLEKYSGQFHFVEIGIQPHCNSLIHKDWLLERGGLCIDIETIEKEGLDDQYKKIRETLLKLDSKERPSLWVSLDMDVFHNNEAPGCSQSWPRGLSFAQTLPFFRKLFEGFDMRGLGIYEVSPPLDSEGRTSKLAALFVYEYLRMTMENPG